MESYLWCGSTGARRNHGLHFHSSITIVIPVAIVMLLLGHINGLAMTTSFLILSCLNIIMLLFLCREWSVDGIRLNSMDIAVTAFFLWQIISAVWSIRPGLTVEENLYVIGCLPAYLLIRTYVIENGSERLIMDLANVGIILITTGLIVYAGVIGYGVEQVSSYRLKATMGNCNLYSAVLLLLWPAHIIRLRIKKKPFSIAVWLMLVIIVIILTVSRSGWLGLMAGGAVLLIFMTTVPRWKRTLLMVMTLLILTTALGLVKMQGREESNRNRVSAWRNSISIAGRRPLTGMGYGTYPYAYRSWDAGHNSGEESFIAPLHAHNIFLHILTETGIPGLLLFLYIMFSAYRLSLTKITANKDERLWHIYAVTALVGFTLHELFNCYLNYPALALPFWLIIGGISSAERRYIIHFKTGKLMSALLLAAAFLLLIFSVKIGMGRFLYTGGRGLYEQGKYELAMQKLVKAAEWDTNQPLYRAYIGKACYRLYEQKGEDRYLKEAIASYELAVADKQPEPRYLLDLAALYNAANNIGKMCELREKAERIYPSSSNIISLSQEYGCKPGFVNISGISIKCGRDNLSVWDIMVNKRQTHWGLVAPLTQS
jgi:O-antigen ligase